MLDSLAHQPNLRPGLLSSISSKPNTPASFRQIGNAFRPRTLPTNVRKLTGGGGALGAKASAKDAFPVMGDITPHTRVTADVTVQFKGSLEDSKEDRNRQYLAVDLFSSKENGKHEEKAYMVSDNGIEAKYRCIFLVSFNFGEMGAFTVKNEVGKLILIKEIAFSCKSGPLHKINCNYWIENENKRVFFTDKSYLPSKTPPGLKELRCQELVDLRGNGEGQRKQYERIYDYDVYNDLGSSRPVLGGSKNPYPRRCRTGRPLVNGEETATGADEHPYVPQEEMWSEKKTNYFDGNLQTGMKIVKILGDLSLKPVFPSFKSIEDLYNKGVTLPKNDERLRLVSPLVEIDEATGRDVLRFDAPEVFERDKFCWQSDAEFARQALAGQNPYCIKLVTEWPIKSDLDPSVYGPAKSAITDEIVEIGNERAMTAKEAVQKKKLFIIDYHDVLVPYVQKVREIGTTATLYASRTLFYLCNDGTLKPIAIELTVPQIGDTPQWRHVFTPDSDTTGLWLWRLAKAHVLAHDTGYHQLVSHWLRTHSCVEPYVIATKRQLSVMHPIYKLLNPHFRYTMKINAYARKALINADGYIEKLFFPGKYSLELSSVAYDKFWRFDMESLPADLVRRGMAYEDPNGELKLTIEDYPYANDGLLLWDAITSWVKEYVKHYYPDDNTIRTDKELQAWWEEVRTKGHADKKDEKWWPVLNTIDSLIQTLTNIIWVASGHHAAVNFGQYAYAGYMPNRPTIARTKMPNEGIEPTKQSGTVDNKAADEKALLQCFPSPGQTLQAMVILYLLSSHSPDEEYIGQQFEGQWSEDPVIKAAFEKFRGKLEAMEGFIDSRNQNPKNKNRVGDKVVPYKLLKPYSKGTGPTGVGVPNSVSI